MESGLQVSPRSAAIQRRNEELEKILAAAAARVGNLSVIREGTHEGPTLTTTVVTPVISSNLPGRIQEELEDSGRVGAKVGDAITSVVVVAGTVSDSGNIRRRNAHLKNFSQIVESKVEEELVKPELRPLSGGKRIEEHQSWQVVPRPHAPVASSSKTFTEVNGSQDLKPTQKVDSEIEGGRKELPPRTTSVSPQTLAIQQKNMELEKQILALQMKAPQVGDQCLSSHSLGIKQRNEAIERRLAQLQTNGSGGRSPATQALNKRNQALEQQLLLEETKTIKRAMDVADQERAKRIFLRACELEKMMNKAQELDLVFLVDVTNSMQVYLDMVKHKVVDIANGVRRVHEQLVLRVAFAPYRDYAERAYDDADTCDFTNSFEGEGSTFIKALTRVRTGGGGDDAEDVFSGLERVIRLNWQATTRVLVHIADAPCHGLQFHDGSVGDHYPGGDIWGRDIGGLLNYLQNNCQIASYLFCHINGSTGKMIQEFKRYTARPGSRPWIEEEQLSSDVDNLVHIVVANACSTISHTISVNMLR